MNSVKDQKAALLSLSNLLKKEKKGSGRRCRSLEHDRQELHSLSRFIIIVI